MQGPKSNVPHIRPGFGGKFWIFGDFGFWGEFWGIGFWIFGFGILVVNVGGVLVGWGWWFGIFWEFWVGWERRGGDVAGPECDRLLRRTWVVRRAMSCGWCVVWPADGVGGQDGGGRKGMGLGVEYSVVGGCPPACAVAENGFFLPRDCGVRKNNKIAAVGSGILGSGRMSAGLCCCREWFFLLTRDGGVLCVKSKIAAAGAAVSREDDVIFCGEREEREATSYCETYAC
jgi:hypothetical protein